MEQNLFLNLDKNAKKQLKLCEKRFKSAIIKKNQYLDQSNITFMRTFVNKKIKNFNSILECKEEFALKYFFRYYLIFIAWKNLGIDFREKFGEAMLKHKIEFLENID